MSAELEIVNLGLVSATSKHEWTGGVWSIDLPDTDQSSLLRGSGEKVASAV